MSIMSLKYNSILTGFLLWIYFVGTVNCFVIEDVKVSYDGYKLIRTQTIKDDSTVKKLFDSFDAKNGVLFFQFPKLNKKCEILVSPKSYSIVKNVLKELNIDHSIINPNIQKLLDEEKPKNLIFKQGSSGQMDWDNYQRYNVILDWCMGLPTSSNKAPNVNVEVEKFGKTGEGRDLVFVKVSNGNEPKPAIWLEGGIHAREWIAPATVTYILNVLVTDPVRGKEILDAFDVYVVPVINADGYEFSHRFDRMWRKNRSKNWPNNIFCAGVDPNRNYARGFGGAGTSKNPCSDVYHGPSPFSEPETKAVTDAISARANQIKLYIGFHSYSQLLLIPWSGKQEKSEDYPELKRVADLGVIAIKEPFGTEYTAGTAPDLIYAAAGGADDYVKGDLGIKYSYTFELRDKGDKGFLLPPDQIKPSGEEIFNGIKAMAFAIKIDPST